MENSAEEKLAIANSEIRSKIADCDDMILYYIRNQAQKVLDELPRQESEGKIIIEKEPFLKLFEFMQRLSNLGNLEYIPDVSRYLDQKKQLKELLGILR